MPTVEEHIVHISPSKMIHLEELTIWSLIKLPMNDLMLDTDSLLRDSRN